MLARPYRLLGISLLLCAGELAVAAQQPLTLRQAIHEALGQSPEAAMARAGSREAGPRSMDRTAVNRDSDGQKEQGRVHWPWFILFFCLAAVANTYVHIFQSSYPVLKHLGVIGLTVTLFLIGTGLSMKTLREVGIRTFLQGILLWIFVAAGSLAPIRDGWIHL